MNFTLEDAKMKDKFSKEDKKVIRETCTSTIMWLETKRDADSTAIEFVAKKQEMERLFNPIMMRIY